MRNYRRLNAERLAAELVHLVAEWRRARWPFKFSIAKEIARTVSFNVETIAECLRGGEGK